MKAVSPLVGFVLTIFMTITITTLTFTVIKPALERNRGFNIMNEASVNVELLSSAINEVATEAEGSRRTLTLSVSDGEYFVDKNSNTLVFSYEPSVDLGVIGRIGDKFLEKGLHFFDFFNNYLNNVVPPYLNVISGNWIVRNNRLEGINGTAYLFIDKILKGFYVASNFGSDNNLGQIFVSPVNLSGLVLYLTFDEGSGNITYDYSGNKNNGTLIDDNATNYDGVTLPKWVDGKSGKALQFDGVDDYVVVPDAPPLNPNRLTVCTWVRIHSYSNEYQSIVNKGVDGATRYQLRVMPNPNNKFEIGVGNGSSFTMIESTTVASLYKWYFVVATVDGSTVKIYVNGILENSKSQVAEITPINKPLIIGARNDFRHWLNGTIDEVMIFNRSLTEEEIRFLYEEGLKKLQNSGMQQFNSRIKPYIAISNPSGKIYVENLRVGNQNSKEIKIVKPFYNLEFESSFRFSKGSRQIRIENVGFNSTSKRAIIKISEV